MDAAAKTETCAGCGTEGGEIHHHHVIPRSYGGEHGPTTPLCPNCHDLVHKAARNLATLKQIGDAATRHRIAELAKVARRAEQLVQDDPNKSVAMQDRLPPELAAKVADLSHLHGLSKKEAVRLAIRNEHARWFGHRRALRRQQG